MEAVWGRWRRDVKAAFARMAVERYEAGAGHQVGPARRAMVEWRVDHPQMQVNIRLSVDWQGRDDGEVEPCWNMQRENVSTIINHILREVSIEERERRERLRVRRILTYAAALMPPAPVYVTTAREHQFAVGDRVRISGIGDGTIESIRPDGAIAVDPASGPDRTVFYGGGRSTIMSFVDEFSYDLVDGDSGDSVRDEYVRRAATEHARNMDRMALGGFSAAAPVEPPQGYGRSILETIQDAMRAMLNVPLIAQQPTEMTATEVALRREQYRQSWDFARDYDWERAVFRARGYGTVRRDPDPKAAERGIALLKENLTEDQRKTYERYGYFEVTGGRTGNRYRIQHGCQQNVYRLDQQGHARPGNGLCFYPYDPEKGSGQPLVAGDCMLAQKITLEIAEDEALKVGIRF